MSNKIKTDDNIIEFNTFDDFKNNMLQSKRFAVWKIKSLIVVDIQDLWKHSSD